MPFRSQAEAARGGKGQGLRIARNLSDNKGEIAAAQPFLQGEKRIFRASSRDMDQSVTQLPGQPRAIRAARALQRLAVLYPQPGTLIGRIGQGIGSIATHPVQRQGQSQRRSRAVMGGSEYLAMQRGIACQARTPFGGLRWRQGGRNGRIGAYRISFTEHMFYLCSHSKRFAIPIWMTHGKGRSRRNGPIQFEGKRPAYSCGGWIGTIVSSPDTSSTTSTIPRPR